MFKLSFMARKNLLYLLFALSAAAALAASTPRLVFAFQEPWLLINNGSGIPVNYQGFGVAFNDSVTYLIGGKDVANNRSTDVYSYNTDTNSYFVEAPLPIGLEKPEAVFYNNYVYVFGGIADDDTVTGSVNSTVYRYNILSQTWSVLGDAPVSPGKAGMAVQGSKVYFYGGQTFEGIQLFDLASENWSVLKYTGPRGLSALWYPAGFSTTDGKVHFYGGRNPDTNSNFNDVVTYDPAAGSYTMSAIPAYGHVREGAKAITAGTKVFFAGGQYFNGTEYSTLPEVVVYNTQLNSWSTDSSMPFTSADHGVSAVSGSKSSIYLYYQTNVYRLLSFDINPLSQWTEVNTNPEYPQNRNYYGSGYDSTYNHFYIVGGHDWDRNHAIKTVYQYSPDTRQYIQYPDLPVGLEEPNVAVIGRSIYVFGGVKGHYVNPNRAIYKYYLGNGSVGSWVYQGAAPRDLYRAGMAVKGRDVYFYGGTSSNGLTSYNLDSGLWTQHSFNDPRGVAWVSGSTGFVTPDGKIHFYGGKLSSGIYTNNVVTYDPVNSTLRLGTIPSYGILKSGAQVVKAGSRFYFFGGWDGRPGCG